MAIKIYEQFKPFANPADGDHPYGSFKNDSIPGAEDGTPLDAVWANDYAGTDAELFAQAGIVPNGQPDKLGASQRVDAIKQLEKAASKVTKVGGGSLQDFIDNIDQVHTRTFANVDSMVAFSGHGVGNTVETLSKNGDELVERWLISNEPFDWTVASVALQSGLKAVKVGARLKEPKNKNLEIVAHRALPFVWMEGTMFGYSSTDADWLEIDVQITSDGVPVLYHDDTLDTKTNGSGEIKNNTIAQVQAAAFLDAIGTPYEDLLRIPTLEEFCKWAADNGRKFWWETKNYRDQTDISIMVDVIESYGLQSRSILNSFIFGDLIYAQTLSNEIQMAYTFGSLDPSFETRIHTMASEWNNKPWVLVYHVWLVNNPEFIETMRGLGIEVAAWTPNKIEEIRLLRKIGINMVHTDFTANDLRGGWYA